MAHKKTLSFLLCAMSYLSASRSSMDPMANSFEQVARIGEELKRRIEELAAQIVVTALENHEVRDIVQNIPREGLQILLIRIIRSVLDRMMSEFNPETIQRIVEIEEILMEREEREDRK